MDPISTFSVVCNVVQIVDGGFRLTSACREIYASGSLASNDALQLVAANVRSISEDIKKKAAADSSVDAELIDLAIKSAETSNQLLSVLEDIKMDCRRSKRVFIRKTVATMWRKKTIEGLQKQLEAYRTALETRILQRLCNKFDLTALRQKESFSNLDQAMRNMIQRLSDGETRLANLVSEETASTKAHITKEEDFTRTCVTRESVAIREDVEREAETNRKNIANEFASLKASQANDTHRKAVMDSLFFIDIYAREESIRDAHKDTFQWIFKKAAQQQRPWSNFTEWLTSGEGIYWVSGKAGAGKSALMNYIHAEERTKDALKSWAGQRELLTPTFFFWNAGTPLQKSSCGLLRSLLYQILEHCPSLVSLFAQDRIPAWTESRLSKALSNVVSKISFKDAICFFIDGLDEFEGDHQALVKLLNDMIQHSNVKICVSSRHLRTFEVAFCSAPRLKLEDLTRGDISRMVHDKLKNTHAAGLADDLVGRANGVFLWVDLAVKDLLRGADNADPQDVLRKRLEELPQEIGDLYFHMLERIEKIYREPATFFLELTLKHNQCTKYGGAISLLEFALARYEGLDAILSSPLQDSAFKALALACRMLKTQIAIYCAGLLEVHAPEFSKSKSSEGSDVFYDELRHYRMTSKVSFIHISAYQFLVDDKNGSSFLKSSYRFTCAATQLFKSRLAACKILSQLVKPPDVKGSVEDLLMLGRAIETSGNPVEQLFDTMDIVFSDSQSNSNQINTQGPRGGQYWFVDMPEHFPCETFIPTALAYIKGPDANQIPGFLVFAAWHGFFDYVRRKLDQLPQAEAKDTANRMLFLVLFSDRLEPQFMLFGAQLLLRYGADAGVIFEVQRTWIHHEQPKYLCRWTAWKAFLEVVAKHTLKKPGLQKFDRNREPLSVWRPLAEELLTQPSVDFSVNVGIVIYLSLSKSTDGEHGFHIRVESLTESLHHVLSHIPEPALVLSISLAHILSHLFGFSACRTPTIEKKSLQSRRVTHVKPGTPPRYYHLSDKQADYLTDAFENWFATPGSAPTARVAQERLWDRVIDVLAEVDPHGG